MEQPIPIFDGHNDVLLRLWRQGGDVVTAFLDGEDKGQLDLPRARLGSFAGGMFACFVPSTRADDATTPERAITPSLAAAREATDAMVSIAKQIEAAAPDRVAICHDVPTIRRSMATNRLAMVLHLEGAEAIDENLDGLEAYYHAGVRSLGPVWSRPNRFGTGVPFRFQASPDIGPGLTDHGKDLVRACNRLGIMIDLSHLNLAGFHDVARISNAPLVATHSCAHALSPTARNLLDDQLKMIRETRGLVALNFSVGDLRSDGKFNPDTPIGVMLDHVDYLVDRLGLEGVALGSDFDGTIVPTEIGDAGGSQHLVKALRDRGFDDDALRGVCNQNWLSVLERTWAR